jgi:hypothetical protein
MEIPAYMKCRECRFISMPDGVCRVAERRQLEYQRNPDSVIGLFPRHRYRPVLDKFRNCEFGKGR